MTTTTALNERFHLARQRVLSYLLKLGHAIDADSADLAEALNTRFCDSLVDYLSAGHFQILERYQPTMDELAAFEATTRQALRFSDQFGNGAPLDLRDFQDRLEALAYVLDARMDIEDDILQRSVQTTNRPQVGIRTKLQPALA